MNNFFREFSYGQEFQFIFMNQSGKIWRLSSLLLTDS